VLRTGKAARATPSGASAANQSCAPSELSPKQTGWKPGSQTKRWRLTTEESASSSRVYLQVYAVQRSCDAPSVAIRPSALGLERLGAV
jgi:hypothetical protein